jgi:site-specific DNA recombinase
MTESNGTNGKPLRFAALIRVSTEGQEKKGESLRTQAKQVEQAVASLGGQLVTKYAGQEHATEGYERQLLDRLLADAGKGRFDAVMVCDPSRWSRDNVKSETGLEVLQRAGVRFFVLTTEYDLYDPHARLFLGLSSTIGAFQARVQRQKSLLNRIQRAKSGVPSSGTLPFGRTYDRKAGTWGVDPGAKALIEDIARRYLAGERLYDLAREYRGRLKGRERMNHANVCRVLRYGCGTEWRIDFKAPDLNIAETVVVTVPRLLDEGTIQRVRERLTACATYLHGNPTHDYLLKGRVFCAGCGYSLCGQPKVMRGREYLYYRHANRNGGADCPLRPRPLVRADQLEAAVLSKLLMMFGNPQEVQTACRAAVPDCEKLLKRKARLESDLAKAVRARERILGLVARDAVSDAEAEAQLKAIKDGSEALRRELDGLGAQLAELPREGDDTLAAFELAWRGAFRVGTKNAAEGLSLQEKRRILSAIFDVSLPGGKPAGVYVTAPADHKPHRPKTWGFVIKGRLYFEAEARSDDECVTQPACGSARRAPTCRPSGRPSTGSARRSSSRGRWRR